MTPTIPEPETAEERIAVYQDFMRKRTKKHILELVAGDTVQIGGMYYLVVHNRHVPAEAAVYLTCFYQGSDDQLKAGMQLASALLLTTIRAMDDCERVPVLYHEDLGSNLYDNITLQWGGGGVARLPIYRGPPKEPIGAAHG